MGRIPILLLSSVLFSPLAIHAQTSGVGGEGVAVGTSDLIGTVQYSDTFTIGSDSTNGTRNGEAYSVGGYPLTTQEAILESAYNQGHSSPTWETSVKVGTQPECRITVYGLSVRHGFNRLGPEPGCASTALYAHVTSTPQQPRISLSGPMRDSEPACAHAGKNEPRS
jgi:hypothetical protein